MLTTCFGIGILVIYQMERNLNIMKFVEICKQLESEYSADFRILENGAKLLHPVERLIHIYSLKINAIMNGKI